MPSSPIPAPPAFPAAEQARVDYQRDRFALLLDDFDELAEAYLETVEGEETADHWGRPSTALNPLSSATRQLNTPGLYGTAPTVSVTPETADALVRELRDRGFWTRAQHVAYLAIGVGVVFRRLGVIARGRAAGGAQILRLTDRVVPAHRVWVRVDPEDPLEPLEVHHLVLRVSPEDTWEWTWDVWRVARGPDGRAVGSYEVRAADGANRSAVYLRAPDDTPGALSGAAFPCRDPETGEAVLPWVAYRATDTGEYWPEHWRRAIHRGSLQAVSAWTYTHWSALFATGEAHLLFGLDPDALPVTTKRGTGSEQGRAALRTLRLAPNTLVAVPGTPTVQDVKVGPGANLPLLLEYAGTLSTLVHVADGGSPSDAVRQGANPSSGIALEINAQARREFSRQVLPLFELADLAAIRIATLLFRTHGAEGLPAPEAYAIRYHTIPLTSAELSDLREQLDWERERGHTSRVDEHLRLYPGKSRAKAIADLVAAAVEDALLDRQIKEALAEAGVPRREPPPPPPPPGDEGEDAPPGDELDGEDAPDDESNDDGGQDAPEGE